MANIKIIDLQTPAVIKELDNENLVIVLRGANPTTETGKSLLTSRETLLKKAEVTLEAEINKL